MLSKNNFREQIIDRGIDYYNRNLVNELNVINNDVYAKVNGYNVYIKPDSYYCSCPCYEYRENCKHLYALLLKIEDLMEEDLTDDSANDLIHFENKAYYEILSEIDKYMTDINSVEILRLGNELLDMIIENEIIGEPELVDKICSYEHILKQIDPTDIFGTILDHLTFIPDYNI